MKKFDYKIKKRAYRKVCLSLILCIIFFYLCLVGIRMLKYEEYAEACKKEWECLGCTRYRGKFNVFTGCSIVENTGYTCCADDHPNYE